MAETCDTVVIESDNGPVVINAADYDEAVHKLVDNEQVEDVVGLAPETAPVLTEVVEDDGPEITEDDSMLPEDDDKAEVIDL